MQKQGIVNVRRRLRVALPPPFLLVASRLPRSLPSPVPLVNFVEAWLQLIGTPERAAKLLDSQWTEPAVALFGARGAELAYANPLYRDAIDRWDVGQVIRRDLIGWAEMVRDGKYSGAIYSPVA